MSKKFDFKSIFIALILIGFTTTAGIAAIWEGLNLLNWDLTSQEQSEFDNEKLSYNEYIYIYSGETKLISFPRKVETINFSKDSGFSIRTLIGWEWTDMSNNPEDYEVMQWYIVRNFGNERVNIHVTYSPIISADQTLYQKELKAGWNLYAPVVKNDYCSAVKTGDALQWSNYSQIIDFSNMWFKKYFSNEVSIDHVYSGETLFFNKYNGNPQDFREDGNYSIKNNLEAENSYIYEGWAYGVFVNNDTLVSGNQNITDASGNELIKYNSHPLVIFKNNSSNELDIVDNWETELLNFDLTSKFAGNDEKGTSSILASLSISAYNGKWTKLSDVFDNLTLTIDWVEADFTTTYCRLDDKLEKCNNWNTYLHLVYPKVLTRGVDVNFVLSATTKTDIKTEYDIMLDLSNTLILDDQNLLPYCKYEWYILGDKNYNSRKIHIDTTQDDIIGELEDIIPTYWEEVTCNSEQIFNDNACEICYNWWKKVQWDEINKIHTIWKNTTDSDQIFYKENNNYPEMINLNWSEWEFDSQNSWKYSSRLENIYSGEENGYILGKWLTKWLYQTEDQLSYTLVNNSNERETNIGLLKYSIRTHSIDDQGIINLEWNTVNSCVLFKSLWNTANLEVVKSEISPVLNNVSSNVDRTELLAIDLIAWVEDVTLQNITLEYTWSSNANDISKISIYNWNDKISNGENIVFNNNESIITFTNEPVIKAWESLTFMINANINESVNEVFHKLSIIDIVASNIVEMEVISTWIFGVENNIQAPTNIVLTESSTWSLNISWDSADNASGYAVKFMETQILMEDPNAYPELLVSPWLSTTETTMLLDGLKVWTEYTILIASYSWKKETISEEVKFSTNSENK